MYKRQRLARFIEFVSLWTILLALTGLLGLIIFISRDRIKEIGIRKVNGASVPEIVRMLNRNVLVWLGIAFIIATPIAYWAMSRSVSYTHLDVYKRQLFLLFAVLFGFIAAFYPSRYITSSPISQAVKGKMFFSGKGKRVRGVLITIQFVFAIALIAVSLTIEKQLNYWHNFDIGIDKENVLYMNTGALQESSQAFADELMKNSAINNYCYAQFIPGRVGMGWGRNVDGQDVMLTACLLYTS